VLSRSFGCCVTVTCAATVLCAVCYPASRICQRNVGRMKKVKKLDTSLFGTFQGISRLADVTSESRAATPAADAVVDVSEFDVLQVGTRVLHHDTFSLSCSARQIVHDL
jgi:hypothetical protein